MRIPHPWISRFRRLRHRWRRNDPATGLLSNRLLEPTLRRMLRRDDVSLALFDIDHLKEINNQFGLPVGDAAICKLAELVAAAAPEGSKAFRVGGEEMGLAMPGAGAASQVAERVRARYEAADLLLPYAWVDEGKRSLNSFTCSAGVGSAPREGATEAVQQLQERTWRALAEAKELGRNRVCMAEGPEQLHSERRGHGEQMSTESTAASAWIGANVPPGSSE